MALFDAHTYLTFTPLTECMAGRDQVLATMRRYGIDATLLISGLSATCDFSSGNRHLKGLLDTDQGLYGAVTLNVEYPEQSIQEQRAYLARREFLASVIFQRPGGVTTLSDAHDIVNAQRRYTKPVAIHAPSNESVQATREIAKTFPQIKFILLTMGGDEWRAAVEAAKDHVNIYLEISGSLDADKIAFAVTTLGSRRILYGSGLPYSDPVLPQTLVETSETLTTSDRNRIFSENARTLFNLAGNGE